MSNRAKNRLYIPVQIGGGNTQSVGTFSSDIPVVLSGGKTLGRYTTGQTIPATGKTAEQVLKDIALEYVNPAFSAFSVSAQATAVEVGTTLNGLKTFTWAINQNSGIVPTIDLYDISAANTLIAGTANDGNQSQAIATKLFTAEGQTQQWRAIGNNTSPAGTFNSSTFTVTAYYRVFFAPVAAVPTNSSQVRALAGSQLTNVGTTFILNTGTVQNTFCFAIPATKNLTSVIDLDALNANLTSSYVQSNIQVADANGTLVNYKLYTMTSAVAYSSSHRHQITFA